VNIQSVKTALLQQRLVEFSQETGCSDISTIVLSFALSFKVISALPVKRDRY
jgi:hypothetical protein